MGLSQLMNFIQKELLCICYFIFIHIWHFWENEFRSCKFASLPNLFLIHVPVVWAWGPLLLVCLLPVWTLFLDILYLWLAGLFHIQVVHFSIKKRKSNGVLLINQMKRLHLLVHVLDVLHVLQHHHGPSALSITILASQPVSFPLASSAAALL